MSNHIPEPLVYRQSRDIEYRVPGEDNRPVAFVYSLDEKGIPTTMAGIEGNAQSKATGLRLVACYNALAGISDPAAIPDVIAALYNLTVYCEKYGPANPFTEIARAALAKLDMPNVTHDDIYEEVINEPPADLDVHYGA